MSAENPSENHYTDDVDVVIRAEKDHINKAKDNDDREHYVGLAFSGGGIRSASFALGVMQSLVTGDKLKKVDYLSTVSGGGYIGSALTWFLSKKIPEWMRASDQPEAYFGTEQHNFPLGQKYIGNRTDASHFQPNAILDYIRQHGNYLIPGQGITAISMVGYVLRAVIVSLSVYLCLLIAFMVLFQQLCLFEPVGSQCYVFSGVATVMQTIPGTKFWAANGFFALATLCLAVFLLLGFSYSLFTRLNFRDASFTYRFRVFMQKRIGTLLTLIYLLVVVGTLKITHSGIEHLTGEAMRMPAAGGSAFLGLVGALSQYRQLLNGGSKFNNWMVVFAGALMIYGLGLMAYWLAEQIIVSHSPTLWVTIVMLLVTLLVSTCVNINYLGMHRMYRDRLMETFMPNLSSVRKNSWGLATEADTATIETMCQENPRPYHLVNANITLVDSHISKYRGRGGDSFTLSSLYCGSDATGWRKSSDYMHGGFRSGMALSTAMSISGAAVNPNDGVAGKGVTRDRIVATVLSILNLRLGFWAPNPNRAMSFPFPPNFLYPALTGGVLSGGLKETRRAIELSDGGHFENLAVYELIRRKTSVIICSDAGADPSYKFADLANLVERIRVDFGASIEFESGDYALENLLPGSETDDYFVTKYNGAKNGFALADIRYHDGSKGKFIYIKSTLVKNLPADILGYKTADPSFPDQPTTDQFFDEPQFEAYRELGYCLGQQMLEENKKPENQWF